jgi:L-aminopeptidase/D-esterase-like protein
VSGFAPEEIRWLDEMGEPVSCIEKLRVLAETLTELRQMAQDALEDAILMGCAEAQTRQMLRQLVESLDNPYRKPG